ncbi:hypothetical protein ACIP39_08680 [Streptomyces tibetensis]|uniref:hypothetical protein n=1 Tax=Streptomyces tibetensis TaxID=2382123 RepID=UPI0038145717
MTESATGPPAESAAEPLAEFAAGPLVESAPVAKSVAESVAGPKSAPEVVVSASRSAQASHSP